MLYDCVLFNDELDILELRLEYLYDRVDYFVIGESTTTFSNQSKPLYFKENSQRFDKYKNKIVHLEIPSTPNDDVWEVEFYQRNYLKMALKNCTDDDLVIIADVDEFIDLDHLFEEYKITRPGIIEMPLYYYFLNLKTAVKWQRTLITPWSFIKNFDIGDRVKYFDLKPDILSGKTKALGWHFSYLFGYNTDLYQSKLKSFSHQEVNTPHFLDPERIKTCLSLGVDILERNSVYDKVNLADEISSGLFSAIKALGLEKKLSYHKPGIGFYLNPYHLKYYLKFSIKPRLKIWLNGRMGMRSA